MVEAGMDYLKEVVAQVLVCSGDKGFLARNAAWHPWLLSAGYPLLGFLRWQPGPGNCL